ncbi:hypothetical protein [Acidianus brierleyi]|uniref:Uncharacterized protein n=1 Tax=Acidianus brierleyi TaxID=41673 RepID=A0A2U9IIJ4_9CREN|nr:hypothetical protein [Acidianus brierleyi]AWR95764.1 hypothetical protein DFR85_15445 [Acidianus brierleyi]
MRLGLILLSIGILILVLGEITFPFTTTITVKSNFTSPPWFTLGKIYVNKGNFSVYSNISDLFVDLQNLTKGQSISLNNFTLVGKGNATVTFTGLKIFYNKTYINFSIIIIFIGIILEILRFIKIRLSKS